MSFQKEYGHEVFSLLEKSTAFFLIGLDLHAQFTFVNTVFAHTFSFLSDDLTRHVFSATLPLEDKALGEQLIKQLKEKGKISSIHIRHLQKDHSWLWISWEFSVIKEASGQIKQIMGVGYKLAHKQQGQPSPFVESSPAQTISEDKSYLLELKNSLVSRLETSLLHQQVIVNSTTNVTFFVDPAFVILAFNKNAAQNAPLLHKRELQAGDSILEYMDGVQQLSFKQHFAQAMQGEICFVEDQIHYQEGISFWLRTEFHPVSSKEGKVIGVVLHISNIDDHKRLQQQLFSSESNLRAIINNSNALICLADEQQEIIDFNSHFALALQRIFGISLKRKQRLLEFFPDPYRRKWQQRYALALAGRKGVYLDKEKWKGREYVLDVKIIPILIEGSVKAVSVYIHDISRQQFNERKLKAQNEKLIKVNTELDKFVYSASHDLRAPLMSILGLINIFKLETDEQAKAHYLDLMRRSVDKLDGFIEDIINLSRNARLQVQRTQIDFQKLIDTALESLQYMAGNESIKKRIFLQVDIPFYSDEKRLQVIFKNVLSNSIRYMNERQQQPYVEIRVETTQEQAHITISDNGTGIGADHLEKVFQIFYRASEQKTGSGLGLYIVKEAVEKLKGKVFIRSQLHHGTSLELQLPNAK